MTYIEVRWMHQFPTEPVLLLSELDAARTEVRKLEVFPDGRMGFAGPHHNSKSTRLGDGAVPSIQEINQSPEFAARETSQEEFEDAWALIDHRGER